MRLFHRTTKEAAAAIFATGFRDVTAQLMHRGVWLSNVPLEADEMTQVLLIVELAIAPSTIALSSAGVTAWACRVSAGCR